MVLEIGLYNDRKGVGGGKACMHVLGEPNTF